MKIRFLGFRGIRECDIMEVDITEFRVYFTKWSYSYSIMLETI
jgi:hypothetical protein